MSKLIATLVASLFVVTAYAQNTPGVPPTQPAAGTTASTTTKATPTDTTAVSDKKAARIAKSKARKAKRDAKVGDKPIN